MFHFLKGREGGTCPKVLGGIDAPGGLRTSPSTGVAETDAKTQSFARYFHSTWIAGDFPPVMWSHFDNLGPRTTNLAEGFHNGMNSRFGLPHPSLRLFLDWLQKLQYEVQCRGLQLDAGRPPKQSQVYAKVTKDLQRAKVQYSMNIGSAFAHVFPHNSSWELFRQHALHYLSHVGHLIGLH